MQHTKGRKLISWKVLDRYKTSRGIAAFLRKHKIKGDRRNQFLCPLATATNWKVDGNFRTEIGGLSEPVMLTEAERDFVLYFDTGEYPYLERK